jgi:hypothetical protein
MDGGNGFRARFGVERNGKTLLAEGSYLPGSEIKDGYPEFTMGVFKKLGWDKDLTPAELTTIEKVAGSPGNIDTVSWSTDLSGGISASRSSMAVRLTVTERRVRLPGICPIQSPSIENRFIRRASILLQSIRHIPTRSSSGCRTLASRCRERQSKRASLNNFH